MPPRVSKALQRWLSGRIKGNDILILVDWFGCLQMGHGTSLRKLGSSLQGKGKGAKL